MSGKSESEFRNAELDAGLLATPFGVQTNWHVISGAPSCGKTTLINLLAARGVQVAPEGARIYLERELERGRSLEEIRSNSAGTERGIAEMQLEIERGLPHDDRIFLDRAVPDCLAWYRYFGLDPNELLRNCFHHRYASIFLLERLPLQPDGLRFRDDMLQVFSEQWHVRDYTALGYGITRVPVLPPEERLAFVLRLLAG